MKNKRRRKAGIKAERREKFRVAMWEPTDPELCECDHEYMAAAWHRAFCPLWRDAFAQPDDRGNTH